MDKQKILAELQQAINEFLPILKSNNNLDNVTDSLLTHQDTKTKTIVKIMSVSENRSFLQPVKTLMQIPYVVKNYTEEYIQTLTVELYHQILLNESNIDQKVKSLFDQVLDPVPVSFYVVAELENIRVNTQNVCKFLDSEIFVLSEENTPLDFSEPSPLLTSKMDFRGKPVISTIVEAIDSNKAKELALYNFAISINLLRLYLPNFKPVLKGGLLSGDQSLIIYDNTTSTISTSHSRIGDLPLNHAYMDDNLYSQLQQAGISLLSDSSDITKIVKKCLYWFGLGLDEKHPAAKILNFVTILESTLKKKCENSELSRSVSERGAILLYDDFNSRVECKAQLKQIYNSRSKIVHTGALLEDKDLGNLSGAYAKAVLIKLIRSNEVFSGNFDKFIQQIDDLKMKGQLN